MNRRVASIALGGVAAILLLGTCSVGRARSSVSSELSNRGYTSVKLEMKGPFTFGFDAEKGPAKCSGRITKTPVSMSLEESCNTPAPPAPIRATVDIITPSLQKDYAPDGFDKIECQDVPSSDNHTTCSVSSSNGTAMVVDVDVKDRSPDGSWRSFVQRPQKRYYVGQTMSEQVKSFLPAELAKKKAKIKDLEIDCGKGPFLIETTHVVCRLVNHFKKPKVGSVDLEISPEGKITSYTAKDL